MNNPADIPILVGQPHRAYQRLNAQVYRYDALEVDTEPVRQGTVFQPWEPLPHWRGVRVPITLGAQAERFEWNTAVPLARFLHWDDFVAYCGPGEIPRTGMNAGAKHPGERWPTPFAELPQIVARLRASARAEVKPQLEAMLQDLESVAQQYEAAAEGERWAMGVDNTDNMRKYGAEMDRHLAEARARLDAARALLA
jgi:hypothetical protein